MSESRPNPASATDRAETAAMARMMIPATFQPSVTYSSTKPRRSSAARSGSPAETMTAPFPARSVIPVIAATGTAARGD